MTCIVSLVLFSCDGDVGKHPSPDIYYIVVEGAESSNVTITYTAAIPKNTDMDGRSESNKYITETVKLPFRKMENFWRNDKNIPKPSVYLTNTTSKDLTLLIGYLSDTLMTLSDGMEYHISPIVSYRFFDIQNVENNYKKVTTDSLFRMLLDVNYEGIKTVKPNESVDMELYNMDQIYK